MVGDWHRHFHLHARVRANWAAAAALATGVVVVTTAVACGETPSPYVTSISGAKGQDTPQNAVRGFFDELVRGDYRAAESYVDPTQRQAYTDAIQKAQGKNYAVQIQDFSVVAFDQTPTGGLVGVKVTGQTCLNGRCTPISTAADNSTSLPVTSVNNQWYLTNVSAPS